MDVLLESLFSVGTITRAPLYAYLSEACSSIHNFHNCKPIRAHGGPIRRSTYRFSQWWKTFGSDEWQWSPGCLSFPSGIGITHGSRLATRKMVGECFLISGTRPNLVYTSGSWDPRNDVQAGLLSPWCTGRICAVPWMWVRSTGESCQFRTFLEPCTVQSKDVSTCDDCQEWVSHFWIGPLTRRGEVHLSWGRVNSPYWSTAVCTVDMALSTCAYHRYVGCASHHWLELWAYFVRQSWRSLAWE